MHPICSSVSRQIHSDWHTGHLVAFCHAAAQMLSLLQQRVTTLFDILNVFFNLFDNFDIFALQPEQPQTRADIWKKFMLKYHLMVL